MKRFMEITVQLKFVWGLVFSTAILIYTVVCMYFGQSTMDFIAVWELVVLTLFLTFVYYLIFAEFLFNSLSTRFKVIVHAVLSYILIILSADLFGWFNITDFHSLAPFTIGYVLLYLAAIFSFYAYYKATGEELNDKLASYKQKKNIK